MGKSRCKTLLHLCNLSPATAQVTPNGQRTSAEKFALLKELIYAKVHGKMDISVTDIHRYTKVSRPTIHLWISRAEKSEPLDNTIYRGGPAPTVVTPQLVDQVRAFTAENLGKLMTRTLANAKFTMYRQQQVDKKKKGKTASKIAPIKSTSFKKLRKVAHVRSVVARAKPELSVFHADKRMEAAKERLAWSLEKVKGIIWIDETCGSRADGGLQTQVLTDSAEYRQYGARNVPRPDPKCEKVHVLVGASGIWKSPIEHLAVKKPVERHANGKAKYPTGAARRKFDKNNPGKNKLLNKANEGETWTTERLMKILLGPKWLPHLKKAPGVIIDNAPAHKAVIAALKKKGVNVIDHPPGSPDFNLCEQLHKELKGKYSERTLAALNNVDLLAAYKKNWEEFQLKKFQKHIDNYHTVMRECLAKNGGPTRF